MSNVFSPCNAQFKVIGVGGAGCQMVSRMAGRQIPSPSAVEYIAMDTDAQSLAMADVPKRIQLGERLLHGLGSGNDPDMGRRAAEESRGVIRQTIMGSDIFFIVAAMGGGTGAGSSPVIAEMAYRMGALTIGMAATPFAFEGAYRMETARQGVAALLGSVDSLIVMPQDLTASLSDGKPDVGAVFQTVTDLMAKGVEMLTEAIYFPGLINLDFADVRSILKDSGLTEMSFGCASGEDRAVQTAYATLANFSSDATGKKAKAALFVVAGNSSLTLYEVNSAADVIKHEIAPDANITFAVNCEEKMGEEMKVALIVTGFAGAENSGLRGDGK
ncbi:MAG: cell division protein FtsZ [Dehalococcoidia bacterium]|nr:MAG: cell division protein FtsZ [Dehalococcoidia bacterium]